MLSFFFDDFLFLSRFAFCCYRAAYCCRSNVDSLYWDLFCSLCFIRWSLVLFTILTKVLLRVFLLLLLLLHFLDCRINASTVHLVLFATLDDELRACAMWILFRMTYKREEEKSQMLCITHFNMCIIIIIIRLKLDRQ